MNIISILIKALPSIIQLVALAEYSYKNKPKSGVEKKVLVMEGAKAIIEGVQAISTGGQAETLDKIKEPVSVIIDNVAKIAFPNQKT